MPQQEDCLVKMPQQEDCLVVFESIPLIYRVVKLSKFLRTSFSNVINVLGKIILHNQS